MERMREYLCNLVRGWNVQQVREIVAETLHELIDPIIYAEAAALIEQHRLAGRAIVIVSSSGAEVVEPIGAMLGADQVIATRLVVRDGCYTGEVDYYAYGETKAVAVRELSEAQGYDLDRSYAYSDSSTDIPLLGTVGHPHAVNPDRGLRKEAAARDWPVLSFERPVRLRRRMPGIPDGARSGRALAALGAVLLIAGAAWYASRRRSRSQAEETAQQARELGRRTLVRPPDR
jgi:HAD superfamily hydrolase (TIGR01490 family)